jgi:hypothetical protein
VAKVRQGLARGQLADALLSLPRPLTKVCIELTCAADIKKNDIAVTHNAFDILPVMRWPFRYEKIVPAKLIAWNDCCQTPQSGSIRNDYSAVEMRVGKPAWNSFFDRLFATQIVSG